MDRLMANYSIDIYADVCPYVCACVCVGRTHVVRACEGVRVPRCVHERLHVRALVGVCALACTRACTRACVRVRVCVAVCLCVNACMWPYACAYANARV